ncbi:MAG: HTH-type transcriptional activator RhaS [Candidatus Celerinatantimonas neptuna]|nr:MAG: HTH-type transcriptional activator RhaS [Candidatus Celerinatantimonas neptuna]
MLTNLSSLACRYQRSISQLIENRTLFEHQEVNFSIYDTFQSTSGVELGAESILYCGMLKGRKIMHGEFVSEFLPHESFVMAPGQRVNIDFPDASVNNPTICMTFEIEPNKLREICDMLNQRSPLPKELGDWHIQSQHMLHTFHTEATQQLLLRIANSFLCEDPDKDLVLKLGVTELLARILRHNGREFLLNCAKSDPTHSALTQVMQYIEEHLNEKIEIDDLCKLACMSRSKLYLQFRNIVYCSPKEYIVQRRLEKARQLLSHGYNITQVCFDVGFSHPSHFTRRFNQQYGITPREFVRHYNQPALNS